MTPGRERWAEAVAIEKQHGADAPIFIARRIGQLARAGDVAGIRRWQAIQRCLQEMNLGDRPRV